MEMITKHIYVRIGSNGTLACVSEDDIERGIDLDDCWPEDGNVTFYDRRIAITAVLPEPAPEEPTIDGAVTLSPPVGLIPEPPVVASEA